MPAAVAARAEHAALRIAEAGMIDRPDGNIAAGGEHGGDDEGERSHAAYIRCASRKQPEIHATRRWIVLPRRDAARARRPLWRFGGNDGSAAMML